MFAQVRVNAPQFRPTGFIASRLMWGYHRTAASQLTNCHPAR